MQYLVNNDALKSTQSTPSGAACCVVRRGGERRPWLGHAPCKTKMTTNMDEKLPSCVTITPYGKMFFDENGRICATFDKKGNGYASFPSGNVALTLTDLGGSICDDDRDIVEEWLWRKPPHGPRKPFSLRLCGQLSLLFEGRYDNAVVCSNGARVQCGRPGSTRDGTYMDRVEGRHPDGRLKLRLAGKNALSLTQRQQHATRPGGGQLALVQEKHWHLPKVSPAEAQQISARFPKGGDLAVTNVNNDWIAALNDSGKIKPGENLWRTQLIKTMAEPPDTTGGSPFAHTQGFVPFGSTGGPGF